MNGDVTHSEAEPPSLPRKVHLVRGSEGYGFNLHGEKGIHGQFISAIDDGSPASQNGMQVGDRVIGVNGEDVEDMPHSRVVEKIRLGGSEVTLVVVDELCDQFYKDLGVKIPQDKFEDVSVAKEADVGEEQQPASEEVVANGEEVKAEEESVTQAQPQEVEQVEVAPEVHHQESQLENQEAADTDEINDAYDEVVPLASNQETPKAEEKPIETQPPVVVTTTKEEEEEKPSITTTTTTTTSDTSFNFDSSAARPKPKRNEVKKANVNWKQKHDDFNRL